MPRSKKENKVEVEVKIQNVENVLENVKVLKKKPLLKKKPNEESQNITKSLENISESGVKIMPPKSKLKANKKSKIVPEADSKHDIEIAVNPPIYKNEKIIEKSKIILKKGQKKSQPKNSLIVNDDLIIGDKEDTLKGVVEAITLDKNDIHTEIIKDKSDKIDSFSNNQEIKPENNDIKSDKKLHVIHKVKNKNLIQPKVIEPEISEEITPPLIENDIDFIKTENKYYNFQPKNKNKSKKISDKVLTKNSINDPQSELLVTKSIEPEKAIYESEIVPDKNSENELSDIIANNPTTEHEILITEVADSSKPAVNVPKTHEEKIREKNERIERARILNRMNQLKQNEERRLLKLQSQAKVLPESEINNEKINLDIQAVVPEEKQHKKPEIKHIEKIEKIKAEKPVPKTDEEKLREKSERIEQARILNRMNQLQRNKEKQLLRAQEAQNKLNEQKSLPLEAIPVSQNFIEEVPSLSVKDIVVEKTAVENVKHPAKENIKQHLKDTIKQHTVKESVNESLNNYIKEPENEIISDEHISNSKEIRTKPEHNKKVPKVHLEKPLEEKKTFKPIPDLILDYSILNPKRLLTNAQKDDPFLKNFYDKVEDFLKKELFIEKGFKVLVAVSGGVDSIVLLDCLAILSNKLFFNVYVAHFNHKLRGDSSEKDEKFVASLTQDYNLQFYLASGNVKSFAEKNSISIEHAARQLRYNFFERTARNLNIDYVATAHTADDSAETFLINLIRGSGLTGLSGIPAKRQFVKNISIVRPLLCFHKNELFEYTKKRKLLWRQDESNALMNYTRNKIRLDLLPKLETEYNPSIIDTINRTSRLIYGADEIVKDIVKKNIPNLILEANSDKFSMKISMLQTFSEFLQGEFIQYSWLKYFRLQPLALSTIDRILNLFNSQTGAVCEINSQFFALKDRNSLIFSKKIIEEGFKQLVTVPGEISIGKQKIVFKEIERKDLKYNSDPNIEYFDGKAFEGFIELRTWAEGDSFQPLGMTGEIKISDFLINEKVSLIDKSKILVLTNKMEIIWVVGKRISENFKVKKTSKIIIKAEIIKTDKKS
jgi:tRNA(Ile)-lysidine synthase